LHGQQLTLTFRGLAKNTIFMKKSKIQSLTMWSSLFQDKKSLASIEASIISGLGGSGGTVEDLENRDIIQIYNWYKRG